MIALVTGGCHGLGKVFTEYLLELGYKVYALYNTSVDEALELENNYDNLRCVKCDIKNEGMVENTLFNIDNIDILINNAGIACDNNFVDKSLKEFMSVVETNLGGTFLMTKYSLGKLNNNGLIINISSNNAIDNYNPISMDYDASKAGINILTKDFSLILDSLNKNQRVVSICPGWIATDSVKSADPKYIEIEMKRVNQNKLLEPKDLVKYIIDNKDSFYNGEVREIINLND